MDGSLGCKTIYCIEGQYYTRESVAVPITIEKASMGTWQFHVYLSEKDR